MSHTLQALIACNYRKNASAGQALLLLEIGKEEGMEIEKVSHVDIGWDAEQCLDYLETVSSFFEAFGRAAGNDLELRATTVKQLGFCMFEAIFKVREELERLQELQPKKGGGA